MAYSGFQLRALALAGWVALGATHALAADYLNFSVESAPEFALRPVELGSGWYLRGGLSASNNKGPQLTPEALDGRKIDWAVDVGAGYKLNNWLRTDATLTFNKPRDISKTGFKVICPYQLTRMTDRVTGDGTGFLWDTEGAETCSPNTTSDLKKVDLMLNAYIDLGSWGGFTPFVGVGGGISMLKSQASLKYYKTSDGALYAADLTDNFGLYTPQYWVDRRNNIITSWVDGAGVTHSGQPPVVREKQVWNRTNSKTSYNLAWSLMGGVAYDITPQLKTEFSYRYLNSGSFTSLSSPLVGTVKSKIDSHQMQIGFRYMMD
jgi:opacity protein-like surface antigen